MDGTQKEQVLVFKGGEKGENFLPRRGTPTSFSFCFL